MRPFGSYTRCRDRRDRRPGIPQPRPAGRATHGDVRGLVTAASVRRLLVHGPAGARQGCLRRRPAGPRPVLQRADAEPARPATRCRGCRDGRARSAPDLVDRLAGSSGASSGRTGESIVSRRAPLAAGGGGRAGGRGSARHLIEHADRAGEQIQNALLKALEEPTDRHLFILVADEPARLLPTIRSRCQPMRHRSGAPRRARGRTSWTSSACRRTSPTRWPASRTGSPARRSPTRATGAARAGDGGVQLSSPCCSSAAAPTGSPRCATSSTRRSALVPSAGGRRRGGAGRRHRSSARRPCSWSTPGSACRGICSSPPPVGPS